MTRPADAVPAKVTIAATERYYCMLFRGLSEAIAPLRYIRVSSQAAIPVVRLN